jgi:hypothetical protein
MYVAQPNVGVLCGRAGAILADTVQPSAGAVHLCTDKSCTTNTLVSCSGSCLGFTWGVPRGGISGIHAVTLTVTYSATGKTALQKFIEDFTSTSYFSCEWTLPDGAQMVVEVAVKNKAGSRGVVSSTFVVDVSPPVPDDEAGITNGYSLVQHSKYWNRSDVAVASLAPFRDASSGKVHAGDGAGRPSPQPPPTPFPAQFCVTAPRSSSDDCVTG